MLWSEQACFYVNTETETDVKICYWNIRIVSNRHTDLADNVCHVDFQIICLNETCLKKICFYHKLFPNYLTAFRSHSVSTTKCSAAVVTDTPPAVGAFNAVRICSLWRNLGRNFHQKWPQCTNLLSLSHTHDTKPDVISKYFRISQKNLDTKYHGFWMVISVLLSFTACSVCPQKV